MCGVSLFGAVVSLCSYVLRVNSTSCQPLPELVLMFSQAHLWQYCFPGLEINARTYLLAGVLSMHLLAGIVL